VSNGAGWTRSSPADRGAVAGWPTRSSRAPWRCCVTEGILGVDAHNETGALGVYTDNGFAVAEKFTAYRRPFEVD